MFPPEAVLPVLPPRTLHVFNLTFLGYRGVPPISGHSRGLVLFLCLILCPEDLFVCTVLSHGDLKFPGLEGPPCSAPPLCHNRVMFNNRVKDAEQRKGAPDMWGTAAGGGPRPAEPPAARTPVAVNDGTQFASLPGRVAGQGPLCPLRCTSVPSLSHGQLFCYMDCNPPGSCAHGIL